MKCFTVIAGKLFIVLFVREPEITAFVEEGYKVYDADGNLKEKKEDILIAAEDQAVLQICQEPRAVTKNL